MEIHFLFCMNADFSPSSRLLFSILLPFLFLASRRVTNRGAIGRKCFSRGTEGRNGSMGIDVFIVVSEKVSGYVKSFETFETLRE